MSKFAIGEQVENAADDHTLGTVVAVFPTVDGKVVAGPTAVDLEDKDDWSVRPQAAEEILPKAIELYPPLEGADPIAAYAGLRPAGGRRRAPGAGRSAVPGVEAHGGAGRAGRRPGRGRRGVPGRSAGGTTTMRSEP